MSTRFGPSEVDDRTWFNFSLRGNLGKSIEYTKAAATPLSPIGTQTIIDVDTDSGLAQPVTVTLFSDPSLWTPGGPAVGSGYIINCRIKFGQGGSQTEALVDFVDGTTFTVPCSFLRIEVLGVTIDTGALGTGRIAVGAYVVNLPQSGAPPLVESSILIAQAASLTIPIPAFATHYNVYATANAVTFDTEQLRSTVGATLDFISRAVGETLEPRRIAPTAGALRITNTALLGIIPLTVIFTMRY